MTPTRGLLVLVMMAVLTACGGEEAAITTDGPRAVVVATEGDSSLSTGEPQDVTVLATVRSQQVCADGDIDARVTLDTQGAEPGTTLELIYSPSIPADGAPSLRTATTTVAEDGSVTYDLTFEGDEELVDLVRLTVGTDGPEAAIDGEPVVSLDAGTPAPC